MSLGTFERLARSLATCFCFARVRILAERFIFHRTQFPMKYKTALGKRSCLRFPRVVFMWLTQSSYFKPVSNTPYRLNILRFRRVELDLLTDLLNMHSNRRDISNDSISQISRKSSSLVNTWFGFCAKKVSRSNSFVVKFFSSPLM